MFLETMFKKITLLSLLSAVFLGLVTVSKESPAKAESPNADSREVIGDRYSAESEEDEQDEQDEQDEETEQEEDQLTGEEDQPTGTEEEGEEEEGFEED